MHGFLLTRFAAGYSGARDFTMSTDAVAISGIAVAKPNPDRFKGFRFQAVNHKSAAACQSPV
jgi:hypothetical protein